MKLHVRIKRESGYHNRHKGHTFSALGLENVKLKGPKRPTFSLLRNPKLNGPRNVQIGGLRNPSFQIFDEPHLKGPKDIQFKAFRNPKFKLLKNCCVFLHKPLIFTYNI